MIEGLKQTARQNAENEIAAKITHNLTSIKGMSLLNLILDQLNTIVDYSGALITRLEENQLVILAYRGSLPPAEVKEYRLELEENLTIHNQVIDWQTPLIVPNLWDDSLLARSVRDFICPPKAQEIFRPFQSLLLTPLVKSGHVMGLLLLGHSHPSHFTADQAEAVFGFAGYFAEAVEYDHLYRVVHSLAVLQERDRLAHELHDNVAQALGYINLQLSAIGQLLTSGRSNEAQAGLRKLKQVVGEAYTDVREEIFNLRAFNSTEQDFLNTLRDYIAKYSEFYRINIQLALEVDEALLQFPVEVHLQIIRIIQEALINVRKHAKVNEAVIRIYREDDQLCLSVEDQGQGFDQTQTVHTGQSGFGLQIMAERAESVGGCLELKTPPEGGVQVIVCLPATLGSQPQAEANVS